MKTDRLEEFVRNNRDEFDHLEPSPKVWGKISQATKKPNVIGINRYIFRAAAVILVVFATSVLLIKTNIVPIGNYAGNVDDPELQELIEAEAYYAQQVNGKLQEIRKCYYTNPELKEEVETDLNELEDMYNVLKGDLKENISNKAVIEAMINNNRTRLKLVDDVLEQIKC